MIVWTTFLLNNRFLTDNKEKTVVANSNGDIIVISRTASYLLPSQEIFKVEKNK